MKEFFFKADQMAPIGGALFKIDVDDAKYPLKGTAKKEEKIEVKETKVKEN